MSEPVRSGSCDAQPAPRSARCSGSKPGALRFPDHGVAGGSDVVGQDDAAVGDSDQSRQDLTERGRAGDHVVVGAGVG